MVETHIVEPEVRIDLANHPLHPPETSFRVAPEVEESIRREDVRKSQISRTRIDTERRRTTYIHTYIHANLHTYMHTGMHSHTHIDTHTNKQTYIIALFRVTVVIRNCF